MRGKICRWHIFTVSQGDSLIEGNVTAGDKRRWKLPNEWERQRTGVVGNNEGNRRPLREGGWRGIREKCGGVRSPRPTGDGFPRQCAHWLGMTGKKKAARWVVPPYGGTRADRVVRPYGAKKERADGSFFFLLIFCCCRLRCPWPAVPWHVPDPPASAHRPYAPR